MIKAECNTKRILYFEALYYRFLWKKVLKREDVRIGVAYPVYVDARIEGAFHWWE